MLDFVLVEIIFHIELTILRSGQTMFKPLKPTKKCEPEPYKPPFKVPAKEPIKLVITKTSINTEAYSSKIQSPQVKKDRSQIVKIYLLRKLIKGTMTSRIKQIMTLRN